VRSHCFAVARRYGRDADDIAQEAAIRAWRRRDTCTTPDQPWAWLATITHREAARWQARLPATSELADQAEGAIDHRLEDALDRVMVRPAVAGLVESERLIVLLHYHHDLPVSAIADQLGLLPNTVKVRLHRLRGKLRPQLMS
jgi:RNA polymerase sigma-70 factor (ECF subfamily)